VFPLFATGIVDTTGKLPPVSLPPAANLLLVSLTQVANFATSVNGKFAAGVVYTGGAL
jgi:hypothetical protein